MNPNPLLETTNALIDFLNEKKSETRSKIKDNLDNPEALAKIQSDLAHYNMLISLVMASNNLIIILEPENLK